MLSKIKYIFPLLLAISFISLSSCSDDDDDETPTPTPIPTPTTLIRANLSIDPATVVEGESATITLTLDRANDTESNLTFGFSFGGDVDPLSDLLSLASTELIIPIGETETTLEITTVDDDEAEETESFTLDISTGIPSGATAGETPSITLMITDND